MEQQVQQAMTWTDPPALIALAAVGWSIIDSLWRRIRGGDTRIHARIDDHESRLTAVETTLENRPDMDHVGEIYKKIGEVDTELTRVREGVGEIKGTVKKINTSVDLLMQHHISPGGGK